jgi:hypothetical protein
MNRAARAFVTLMAGGLCLVSMSLLVGWLWIMNGQVEPGATRAVAAAVTNTSPPEDTPAPSRTPWPSPTETEIPTRTVRPSRTPKPSRTPWPTWTETTTPTLTPTFDLVAANDYQDYIDRKRASTVSYVKEMMATIVIGTLIVAAVILFSLWIVKKYFTEVVSHVLDYFERRNEHIDEQPDDLDTKVLDLWEAGYRSISSIVRAVADTGYSSGGGTLFYDVRDILRDNGKLPPTPPAGEAAN